MLHRSHGSDGNSGYAIRHVVHRTGWMIDAVATTTRGATLQSAKLTDKAERKSFWLLVALIVLFAVAS